jgi:prepilin-type processing-associated H-X9-DG protein
MVTIAIIALLLAILLPSLSSARAHAKAVMCSTNLHHVSLAMADYQMGSKGIYPSSYLYPKDDLGNWDQKQNDGDKPHGYMHWSYFLYDSGEVDDKAFQCPTYDHGGAPRTNPGAEPKDWNLGEQVDDNSQSKPDPNNLTDKQAPRMAYSANAAIIPRNKFTQTLAEGSRMNVFVREHVIEQPGKTILVAEFLNNWKAMGITKDGGVLSKSHRPINPFFHVGSGFNEYTAQQNAPGFIYGLANDTVAGGSPESYGLLPTKQVAEKTNILDYTSGVPQINAVGREHPYPIKAYVQKYGGAANFLYCDGHAEPMTAFDSVDKRQWGSRYYSLTGDNKILNMVKPQ